MDLCYIVDGIAAKHRKEDVAASHPTSEHITSDQVSLADTARSAGTTSTTHTTSVASGVESKSPPTVCVESQNSNHIDRETPSGLSWNDSATASAARISAQRQAPQQQQQQFEEPCRLQLHESHQHQQQRGPKGENEVKYSQGSQRQLLHQHQSPQHHNYNDPPPSQPGIPISAELYPRVPLEPKIPRLRPPPIAVPSMAPSSPFDIVGSPTNYSGYSGGFQWCAVAHHHPLVAHSGCLIGNALFNQQILYHPAGALSAPRLPVPMAAPGPVQCQSIRPRAGSLESGSVQSPGGPAATEMSGKRVLPQGSNERILVLEKKLSPTTGVTTKTRQYACNQCGRSFYRRSDLARHIQIHLGIKPNLCPFCGKAFIQRSALTVHVRVHTGEKPYTCQVCGRLFSDSSSLARHRRIHLRQQGEPQSSEATKKPRNLHTPAPTNLRASISHPRGSTATAPGTVTPPFSEKEA